MTYLFVYGIFKRGDPFGGGTGSHLLTQDCEFIGPATAPGFLILDHAGAAAMVPGSNYQANAKNYVAKGEVLSISDEHLDRTLEMLDRVESNGQSYIRAKIEVVLEDGRRVEAYAYLYMIYYAKDEFIPDGSWGRSFSKGVF